MRCTHFQLRWCIEDFSHASTNSHFQENVLSHLITQKSFSKQIIVFRNSIPIFLFHFFLFFCFFVLFCFFKFLVFFFVFLFRFVFWFLLVFCLFVCLYFSSDALLFCSYHAASWHICEKDTTGIC